MGIVIDSSVFIRAERLHQPVDLSSWRHHGAPFISAITVSELLVGVHRANTIARRNARSQLVEATIAKMNILDFDEKVARTHSVLYADTQSRGKPLGSHDLLIAATATHHGMPVLTCNGREFRLVPGLVVLDYDPIPNSDPPPTPSPQS